MKYIKKSTYCHQAHIRKIALHLDQTRYGTEKHCRRLSHQSTISLDRWGRRSDGYSLEWKDNKAVLGVVFKQKHLSRRILSYCHRWFLPDITILSTSLCSPAWLPASVPSLVCVMRKMTCSLLPVRSASSGCSRMLMVTLLPKKSFATASIMPVVSS